MRTPTPSARVGRSQRGSIVIPAAFALFVGILLLGGAQMGYLFYAKRDLQKAADLAALTGAQVLNNGLAADCTAAQAAAQQAARANGGNDITVDATCWRWDPAKNTSDPRHLAAAQAGQRDNSVLVSLTRNVASFFPFLKDNTVGAQAVGARPGQPIATFSLGTSLVTTRPGTLINLLSATGLNLDSTTLVGYDAGLANVTITPSGLLQQLGIPVDADVDVGTLNNLLATHAVPLGSLLDAIVNAGGQSSLLAANVTLVNAVNAAAKIPSALVTLGS